MSEKPILFKGEMVRATLDNLKTHTRRVCKPQPAKEGLWSIVRSARPMKLPGGKIASEVKTNDAVYLRAVLALNFARYKVGDLLWVRETHSTVPIGPNAKMGCIYRADGDAAFDNISEGWEFLGKWTPSIFMPKKAARIWLEVTGVRCERVQDITCDDCINEGIEKHGEYYGPEYLQPSGFGPIEAFHYLWDSINARPNPQKHNPWTGQLEQCFVSYPWDDIREICQHRDLKWYVIGNPYVFVYEFKRVDKAK